MHGNKTYQKTYQKRDRNSLNLTITVRYAENLVPKVRFELTRP